MEERSPDDVVGLPGILRARQPELAELKVREQAAGAEEEQ
jgi:hypothetical protein